MFFNRKHAHGALGAGVTVRVLVDDASRLQDELVDDGRAERARDGRQPVELSSKQQSDARKYASPRSKPPTVPNDWSRSCG